jgi:hypothetical protein
MKRPRNFVSPFSAAQSALQCRIFPLFEHLSRAHSRAKQISNRHTRKKLEFIASHTKQTLALVSNRERYAFFSMCIRPFVTLSFACAERSEG